MSSQEPSPALDARMQHAVDELSGLIRERYPAAAFTVTHSPEDAEAVHLNATVEVEDADEVLDVVMSRVLSLQDDESLPIHVIPLSPIGKALEAMRRPPLQRALTT